MKFLHFVLIAFVLIIFYICFKSFQFGTFNSYIHSKKEDCFFILPPNLSLSYNQQSNEYAIKMGEYYLWARNSGLIISSTVPYTTFSDSCKAKSFVKEYLRQSKEQSDYSNGFKTAN